MGPNLSSIKIFQGTCGCMLCWVFFIVHVMSWLHRAMPLCSTTSKRVPPKITIGCFGLCTAKGCWASQHFLHALVSAWAQRRHALPPGCNSLPCRMPPAALTEASSSSQGIFYIIHATGRSLVMNMPREAQSFMQAGPLALKHGSVTSWLSLSRVYSRWISRRPPQFCDQTHCRRPSVIMKLLLLATCLAYAKADGHEGMEHGNIVEELVKAGSLMMRKSPLNKDSCKMGIVAEWGWQVGWFVGWPACIVTSHPTTHDTSIETNSLPLPTIATISRSQITTPTHLWNSHNSSPFSGAAH